MIPLFIHFPINKQLVFIGHCTSIDQYSLTQQYTALYALQSNSLYQYQNNHNIMIHNKTNALQSMEKICLAKISQNPAADAVLSTCQF